MEVKELKPAVPPCWPCFSWPDRTGLRRRLGTSTKKRVAEIRDGAPQSNMEVSLLPLPRLCIRTTASWHWLYGKQNCWHSPFLFANISLFALNILNHLFIPHSTEEAAVKEEEGAPYTSCQAAGRDCGLTSMEPYKGRSWLEGANPAYHQSCKSWHGSTKQNRAGVAKSLLT